MNHSAPPAPNDIRPTSGGNVLLPVKGSGPEAVVVVVDASDPTLDGVVTTVVDEPTRVLPSVTTVAPPGIDVVDVLVVDSPTVVVGASVVVVVVDSVVVVDDSVVVVVVVVVSSVVQIDSSITLVVPVAVTPSGHDPLTIRVIVPVTAPGTIVVAVVVGPFGSTVGEYPVTSYCVEPIAAVAEVMVIVRDTLVVMLPIVHVTTWSPFAHTVSPESNGWWAHAGDAITATMTSAPATAAPNRAVQARAPRRTRARRAKASIRLTECLQFARSPEAPLLASSCRLPVAGSQTSGPATRAAYDAQRIAPRQSARTRRTIYELNTQRDLAANRGPLGEPLPRTPIMPVMSTCVG
jgi:hypothetical protein